MPFVLLRPSILGFKNSLKAKAYSPGIFARDLVVFFTLTTIVFCTYSFSLGALNILKLNELAFPGLTKKLIDVVFLSFYLLLQFTSLMAVVGRFYTSNDMQFFLSTPVSLARLFKARFFAVTIQSSWVLILIVIPCLIALKKSYNLDLTSFSIHLLSTLPFIIIPCAISTIAATLLVNLVPASKLKEFLTLAVFVIAAAFFYLGQIVSENISIEKQKFDIEKVVGNAQSLSDPSPLWFPHRWYTDIIGTSLDSEMSNPAIPSLVFFGLAAVLTLISYWIFEKLFLRGWMMSTSIPKQTGHNSYRIAFITRLLFPFQQQFRSLLYKELRLILRDTTQSLQLLLLLMLTMLYLYNFKSLRMISHLDPVTADWWKAILGSSNLVLGGCVTAAIATRFVYPSVSLEGKSWNLLRCTPISIRGLLDKKFLLWFLPLSFLNAVLIASGALAVQLKPSAIILSTIAGFGLTSGIVGLAIGIGAVYAKFDWENPTQISSNLGSLIFMVLTFCLLFVNELLIAPLISISEVEFIRKEIGFIKYNLINACLVFSIFYFNLSAAQKAIKAGEMALSERETNF